MPDAEAIESREALAQGSERPRARVPRGLGQGSREALAIESREALAQGPERPRAKFWRRDEFGVEALMSMNWFKCVCD